MPRRFITAEDVRRSGGEIVVDANTLVTPQALEVARELGVVIRAAGGEYAEPAPDRGPDAERASETLPHLPEPSTAGGGPTSAVITVVGANRPGVLAEVTSTLGQLSVNVDDVSQKMVDRYFHLVLLVTLPPERAFEDVKGAMECLGGEDFVVRVMHERVFRFMHRI